MIEVATAVAPRRRDHGLYDDVGEKVYCPKGHHLATVKRRQIVGTAPSPDDWQFVNGMAIDGSRCPACGVRVVQEPGIYYFAR